MVVNFNSEKSKIEKNDNNEKIYNLLANLMELCNTGRLNEVNVIFRIDDEEEFIFSDSSDLTSINTQDIIEKVLKTKSFARF